MIRIDFYTFGIDSFFFFLINKIKIIIKTECGSANV